MSQQHPSRPPGGGHVPPGGWSGRPTNAPSPFRPASPYTPSSSPHPQGRIHRGPPTPVHPAHPMSPLVYPGIMMHPMSPVPIGMPISPGMSPVFGCPTSGYIQCPRPRWPSPIPTGSQAPRPFIPTQVGTPCSAKDDRSIVMCHRCTSTLRVAVLVESFRLECLIQRNTSELSLMQNYI